VIRLRAIVVGLARLIRPRPLGPRLEERVTLASPRMGDEIEHSRQDEISIEGTHMSAFPHRAVHFSLDVLHARTEPKRVIRRFAVLFAATVVVVVLCALAIYLLEGHAHDSDIKSYGLAVYWSASQLLTLGSSFNNPVTTTGRILTVGMDIWAVVVIGTISGTLGALFLHQINERLKAAEGNDSDQEEFSQQTAE